MITNQIPVFYINVATRTDRREHMERQFAELGMAVERIEAVTPAAVPAELVEAARLPDGNVRISANEIACTLSHFAAWQRAIALGASACAVLEDDAVIAAELPAFLRQLGPALPPDIDVLKFETYLQPVRLGRRVRRLGGYALHKLMSTHHGTCGYVISTAQAKELMSSLPLSASSIDHFIFGRGGELLYTRRLYQLTPALSVQLSSQPGNDTGDAAFSDIEAPRRDNRKPGQSRWRLTLHRWGLAWREFVTYGRDTFNTRTPVPFADDA